MDKGKLPLSLAVALLATAGTAFASPGPVPTAMFGTYELDHGNLGICEPLARVYQLPNVAGNGEVEIVAGRFYFPRLGEGRIHYDNYFETRDFQSSLEGTRLTLRERIRNKGNGEVMTRLVRAETSGNRLRLRADQYGQRWETHTDCVYRRASDRTDQLPSDDAIGYPPITAPTTPAQPPVTQPPTTPSPVTPSPVTPTPVTPTPVTPAPVTPTPVTPSPVTPPPILPPNPENPGAPGRACPGCDCGDEAYCGPG